VIKREISALLQKGVIQETEPLEDQVLSNVFLSKKRDGTQRIILNLNLNQSIDKFLLKWTHSKALSTDEKRVLFRILKDLKNMYYLVRVAPVFRGGGNCNYWSFMA